MSRVVYNTIELDHIHTLEFSQEPQYSGNNDGEEYLYTKFTLKVRATINVDLLPGTQDGVNNMSAALIITSIRHRLAQPRKKLEYWVDEDLLIDSPEPGVDATGLVLPDAKNGPFPKVHGITQVGGKETFIIEWSCVTYVVELDEGEEPPAYSSHRFREVTTIDDCWYTRKTRSGMITVRADLNFNPDSMRFLVAHPIPQGFQRVRSVWTLMEDGISETYEIEDQQMYVLPPAPAVKADGYYRETTTIGAIRFAECSVKLEGTPPVVGVPGSGDRGGLLQAAVDVCLTKLLGANGGFNGHFGGNINGPLLKNALFHEDLFRNKVEVTIRVQLPARAGRWRALPIEAIRFGNVPLPGTPPANNPPNPGFRGSAGILLQKATGWIDPGNPQLPAILP